MGIKKQNKPILITGSHRSGTTWVGKTISLSNNVQYIYECFHPNGLLRHHRVFNIWFKFLNHKHQQPYFSELSRILQFDYKITEALSMFYEGKLNLRNSPVRLEFYRDVWKLRLSLNKNIIRPLLKDPIALFSVPWLVNSFNFIPIILIRHPAAFVGSLIRLGWRFNFNNFLHQPDIIDRYLSSFVPQIKTLSGDPIEEAALLWNCLHHVINEYQKGYPGWHYYRHEDISSNPEQEFEIIYNKLNLEFTNEIRTEIINQNSNSNSKHIKSGKIHQLKRDSRLNIKSWKRRLSKKEINKIRKVTEPYWTKFYTDSDW